MRFSQRKGLKPVRELVQKDSIDEALRNALWNGLTVCLWNKIVFSRIDHGLRKTNLGPLFLRYWHSYFQKPLDNLPNDFLSAHGTIREYFFECKWYEIYDFIEFTIENMPGEFTEDFTNFCNNVLESEMSAYRVVDNKITEITAEEEISSIENALQSTDKLQGIKAHFKKALSHLSDRRNPDFRNSIKESISAVEALVRILTGKPKATLGRALEEIETKVPIHPALKSSLSTLYGYTSDDQGIRHAMLDESTLTYTDAKFMLVTCTAFVNYLLGKVSDNGIELKKVS